MRLFLEQLSTGSRFSSSQKTKAKAKRKGEAYRFASPFLPIGFFHGRKKGLIVSPLVPFAVALRLKS
jgi:hypothetical protein